MPTWTHLIAEMDAKISDVEKINWLINSINAELQKVASVLDDRNVIFYGSAFLQKPTANPFFLQITHEDINGFMPAIQGMDCSKGLTLILHTPGGVTNATETIVAYLRSKFQSFDVIVPTYAMSAGTMISLAADKIILGRQSQLGPIDPQMPMPGKIVSAIAIIEQFERAKIEITADVLQAHLWAPILASLGPAVVQEAQNAIDYSEQIVSDWLEKYMFKDNSTSKTKASAVSKHFSRGTQGATINKSHGRRIDRTEARAQGLNIEDLELSQTLQDAVLTTYHLLTILFERSPALKAIISNSGKLWVKNV